MALKLDNLYEVSNTKSVQILTDGWLWSFFRQNQTWENVEHKISWNVLMILLKNVLMMASAWPYVLYMAMTNLPSGVLYGESYIEDFGAKDNMSNM